MSGAGGKGKMDKAEDYAVKSDNSDATGSKIDVCGLSQWCVENIIDPENWCIETCVYCQKTEYGGRLHSKA